MNEPFALERYRCAFKRYAFCDVLNNEATRMKSKGRPLEEGGARVVLSKGAIYVSPQLKTCLDSWRKVHGLPLGRSLDALFVHAVRSEGAFLFKLPLDGARPSLKGAIKTKYRPVTEQSATPDAETP